MSLIFIAFLLTICAKVVDNKTIMMQEIPGGFNNLIPRILHLRNNIQGNVKIEDAASWSIEVTVKGLNSKVEDVKLHCRVKDKENILDIQVYQKTSSATKVDATKADVTADITLRGPGYLIMPGSKIFYNINNTGRTILEKWSGYSQAIEEYEVKPVYKPVDVTLSCYSTCRAACDVANGVCILCKRGYEFDTKKSKWNKVVCKDIDECQLKKYSCPVSTSCQNTIGGYTCKCHKGYFKNGFNCKACTKCRPGSFAAFPCNSTHDSVCKVCSKPCEGYLYEVHPCGAAYDRFCEDILKHLKTIDKSKMIKPLKEIRGSVLKPFVGMEKSIITDDKMKIAPPELKLAFMRNEAKQVTFQRSSYLFVDLKLTEVDVMPKFVDSDGVQSNEDSFFSNHQMLKMVQGLHCRHPVPDIYILKHNLLKNQKTAVKQFVCKENQKYFCPDDAEVGELYAMATNEKCEGNRLFADPKKLHCTNYVNVASVFGIRKSSFVRGATWKFESKNCEYLFNSCVTCRRDWCSGTLGTVACLKQCEYVCKGFRKRGCRRSSLACTIGDFSMFDLQATFNEKDLSKRFNCYLERKIPDKLFQLAYRVRIPNTKLISSWYEVNTKQKLGYANKIKIGGFDVKYYMGNLTTPTIILSGELPNAYSHKYSYKIRNLKPLKKNGFTRTPNEIRFMPTKPFLFTTKNWKNVSHCKLLSQYEKYLAKIGSSLTDIKVEQINTLGSSLAYRLVHMTIPTVVGITLNSSTSVLMKLGRPALVKVLNGTLRANAVNWVIHIKGNVTQCLTYFELYIVEETMMVLLLHQDILVLCPSKYFHVVALVPKREFKPYYKARLFVAYVSDGKHTYEIHMEKRLEMMVKDIKGKIRAKRDPTTVFDMKMLKTFDPLIILTGCFVLGLIVLAIFSCLIKPSGTKKSHEQGKQQAELQFGRPGLLREGLDKEDKLQNKHLVPIIFLVTARVAYSFLLTASVVAIIFRIMNKEELLAMQDFNTFVELKVNESNQIALALDIFRETEVKIMTDKSAFLECACDYHMVKMMRNMRDNITAIVQLHALIAFDKISEMLKKTLQKEVLRLIRETNPKFARFEKQVRQGIENIENRLIDYSYRVYHNKYFSTARSAYGMWQRVNGIDFLGRMGVFDVAVFRRMKEQISGQLRRLKSMFNPSAIIKRLVKPLYPLANALLAPYRLMKQQVKQAIKDRLNRLKNIILSNIPCLGNVDTRKWKAARDEYDDINKKRCNIKTAVKIVEKVVDSVKKIKNRSGESNQIKSIKNDAAFDILKGDSVEEQYEMRQQKKLDMRRKLIEFYKADQVVVASFRWLQKHSFVIIIVFDVLLITYRCLKTYRFAFMMAMGYEVVKQHKRLDGAGRNGGETGQKMIGCFSKLILKFFSFFTLILKIVFTSLIIPVLMIMAAISVLLYLFMAFTYNAMNVSTLSELGAFKMLSSRLDLNFNLTKQSLKDHAQYLNEFDIGAYEDSIRVQTSEFSNTVKEFNADEIISFDRLKAELCDIDSKDGCNINFQNLMQTQEMNVKPCMFPVIKSRMPDNIYDSEAYRRKLKHGLKQYVDALRAIIIRTFYLIVGVIGTIILFIFMSKVIFKFLKFMGMVRIKNTHVYEELPRDIQQRYKENYEENNMN